MPSSRRTFLAGGAAAGVGLAVAGAVPSLAQASPGRPHPPVSPANVPVPAARGRPRRASWPCPRASATPIVTRTGVTRLDRGRA